MKLTAKRILVMRYRFIGDTVLTVPFLRNLRAAYPEARIDLMLEPFSGSVIEGCPYVDTVIPFELKTIHKYSNKASRGKLAGYLHYSRMIRKEGYDAVFVLKRSLSSALLAWTAGIPRRIGFATEGRNWLLTDPVRYRQDQHEVENFLDCLRSLHIPIASTALELWPAEEDKMNAAGLLSGPDVHEDTLKIVIHATASLPAKQWPLERFAAVMSRIADQYSVRFIYTGAKEDKAIYDELEKLGPFGGLDLCGKSSLRQNLAVYGASDLFFGVDSGPMHMAAAMGVPVVALFGPTNDTLWGPWGSGHTVITKRLPCGPCKPHKCDDHQCMKQISVDEAHAALSRKAGELLAAKNAAAES